jgi:hypothetical protein
MSDDTESFKSADTDTDNFLSLTTTYLLICCQRITSGAIVEGYLGYVKRFYFSTKTNLLISCQQHSEHTVDDIKLASLWIMLKSFFIT